MVFPVKIRRASGPLTVTEISQGLTLAVQNARSLLDDADLLAKRESPAGAASLALAALQEVGKFSLLIAMARTEPALSAHWERHWQAFYQHDAKNTYALATTIPGRYRRKLSQFEGVMGNLKGRQGRDFELLRRMSLYLDFDAKERAWYYPRAFDRETFKSLYGIADVAIASAEKLLAMGLCRPEVLQLEREVFGPFMASIDLADVKGSFTAQYEAVVKSYAARLVEAGFVRTDSDIELAGRKLSDWVD